MDPGLGLLYLYDLADKKLYNLDLGLITTGSLTIEL